MRDTLYLLESRFADPALGHEDFYCRDCMLLHGLVTAFPQAAARLDVVRVAFPRPRATIVAAIGEANQWLPVLVLSDDAPSDLATGEHDGRRFVSGLGALLNVLHVRHAFPQAHP